MQNLLLQAYCLLLYTKLVKCLCSEKKFCRIAVIENYTKTKKTPLVGFAKAGKKYSLPFVIYNKQFQIITKENISSADIDSFDIILSLFNLSSLSKEEQINFIQKMQKLAPKAIFLEYENPERNLAYLGYFLFLLSQYCTCFLERIFTAQKKSLFYFHEYCKSGALEGILYNIPLFLPESSFRILDRKHFGCGGIGMAYCEWRYMT